MTNIQKAAVVKKAFNMLLKETTDKATKGCNKSALNVLTYMTVENEMLRSLGYMVNDNGKIVKFKPYVPTEYEELLIAAAKGDMEAADKLILSLNTNL